VINSSIATGSFSSVEKRAIITQVVSWIWHNTAEFLERTIPANWRLSYKLFTVIKGTISIQKPDPIITTEPL